MRNRDAKVGVAIDHDAGRHLGVIIARHDAVVRYRKPDGTAGIAGYGEIRRCNCPGEAGTPA